MTDMVTDQIKDDGIAALRDIVAGTAGETGTRFFQNLVRHLAGAMHVGYAFIAEFIQPNRARTVAFWTPSGITQNIEWELPGTPCEDVVAGHLCHHPSGVHRKFPADAGSSHGASRATWVSRSSRPTGSIWGIWQYLIPARCRKSPGTCSSSKSLPPAPGRS